MHNFQLKTPVTFIIFKRPETTAKVFEAIRQAKPPKLLVIADGPREDRVGEAEKCTATRAIIDRIDWDCEVLKNYSEINLGCDQRVSSGLNWVFDQVEEAIILEDDCLPHPTFFRFCEELLERYRYDERIASISGQNIQFGRKRTEYDYYFSRYNHIWGWATWRRAWQYYDFNMELCLEIRERDFFRDVLGDSQAVKIWTKLFQDIYNKKKYDSWDFKWQFFCWIHNRLGILANVNLISNIGFVADSTHLSNRRSRYSNLPVEAIKFPLKHPPFMIRNMQADNFTQKTLFSSLYPSLFQRFIWKIQKIL
ncbi:MAG: glycosyltransferase family 2 protein [Scytonema sp. PMC 1069.18]|nr:glycosyltransferase family 2 protein [Scytonema sp. PMC 1069.18]MEC4882335.1 glycosyltransferase family 2 protein [Scytonema sp. PMC 1070.18]